MPFIPHSSFLVRNSSSGFTVLELLVASLLLGMLMTILTMIFNQSSIAWNTGVAGVASMDDTREYVSDMRYKADNAYEWNGVKYIRSVFDNGQPVTKRDAYISASETGTFSLSIPSGSTEATDSYKIDSGVPKPNGKGGDNYIVNVRSWGPDRKENTRYDNIYSVSPSVNPEEW